MTRYGRLDRWQDAGYTGPKYGPCGKAALQLGVDCDFFIADTRTSDRLPGDVFTLSYNGTMCTSAGLVVSTVSFEYHMFGDDSAYHSTLAPRLSPPTSCAVPLFTSPQWGRVFTSNDACFPSQWASCASSTIPAPFDGA